MRNKSQMQIKYETWLHDKNRSVNLKGTMYYRIIDKYELPLDGGAVVVVIPNTMFQSGKNSRVTDENGHVFKLGSPAHMSFSHKIEQWYLETLSCPVDGIGSVDEIGEYLAVKE